MDQKKRGPSGPIFVVDCGDCDHDFTVQPVENDDRVMVSIESMDDVQSEWYLTRGEAIQMAKGILAWYEERGSE